MRSVSVPPKVRVMSTSSACRNLCLSAAARRSLPDAASVRLTWMLSCTNLRRRTLARVRQRLHASVRLRNCARAAAHRREEECAAVVSAQGVGAERRRRPCSLFHCVRVDREAAEGAADQPLQRGAQPLAKPGRRQAQASAHVHAQHACTRSELRPAVFGPCAAATLSAAHAHSPSCCCCLTFGRCTG